MLSLEGVLIDPRPAVLSVIHHLTGATAADVAAFEATGEYAGPWEIARALHAWVRARRPRPIPPGGWRVVVNQCGMDPGDLTRAAERLYQQREWRKEGAYVPPDRLARLEELARLAVVTDRDSAGLARAEEVLGRRFAASTSAGDAVRPDPGALLRLGPTGHFVGCGPRDRACAEGARFVFHEAGAAPLAVIDRMLSRLAAPAVPPPSAPVEPAEEKPADATDAPRR